MWKISTQIEERITKKKLLAIQKPKVCNTTYVLKIQFESNNVRKKYSWWCRKCCQVVEPTQTVVSCLVEAFLLERLYALIYTDMSRLKITKQVEICKIFKQMVYILKKIGRWWGNCRKRSVELARFYDTFIMNAEFYKKVRSITSNFQPSKTIVLNIVKHCVKHC